MFPNMNCRLHQAKIWDHLKSSEIISAPNPVLCPSCRYTPGAGRSPPIPGHRRSWAMPGPGPAAPSVTGTWPGPWCFQRFRNYGETMTMMKKSRKTGGGTTNYQPPTWEFALRPSCICMSMAGLSDYLLCSAFFPSARVPDVWTSSARHVSVGPRVQPKPCKRANYIATSSQNGVHMIASSKKNAHCSHGLKSAPLKQH